VPDAPSLHRKAWQAECLKEYVTGHDERLEQLKILQYADECQHGLKLLQQAYLLQYGGWLPGGLPGPVITFGKMADGGATPRDDALAPFATKIMIMMTF